MPAFLTPLVTKVLMYVIGGALVAGLVLGGYYSWKRMVVAEANQALIIRQLEQALEESRKFAKQLRALQDTAESMAEDVARMNEERARRDREILEAIDGSEDREASDVLKDVVKRLGGK